MAGCGRAAGPVSTSALSSMRSTFGHESMFMDAAAALE